jgi:hypothetical protein
VLCRANFTEVRRARDTLAAKFGYDLTAIVRDARRRQKQSKRKVVSLRPRKTQVARHAIPASHVGC